MDKEIIELQERVRAKLDSIEARSKKNSFVDWLKYEIELTDKVYLSAKDKLKKIEKFSNEMLLRMFESRNRAKLKKLIS